MNNKNEQYKRMLRVGAIAIIVAIEVLAFWHTWFNEYSAEIYLYPFAVKGHWFLVGMYILFVLLFLYIYGGTKLGYLKKANIIYSQALSVVCANVLMFFIIVLLYRHMAPVMPMFYMTLFDVVAIFVCSFLFEFLYAKLFPPRKTLVVYDDEETEVVSDKMAGRKDKYDLDEFINVSVGMEKLKEEILKHEAVVISDVHSQMRNSILKFCYGESIRVYVTPKISDILVRSGEMLHLFDTPLLLMRNYGLSVEQRLAKRILDIICSLVLIIIASPFMLIAAIAIKAYDRGPVLFKQKRLTIDRKEFYVYKFRSMIVDAEKDGVARLAKQHDSRITPVGNIIRKTRVDELPQLFNVLKGDMSMVGPRPERPEIAVEYEKETPEFAYRLKVKGGLTGYAQVYGKYNTTAYDKLKLDLMYIENYSFLSDLKIMVMTFKILFMKESTEGVDDAQVTASTKEKIGHKDLD